RPEPVRRLHGFRTLAKITCTRRTCHTPPFVTLVNFVAPSSIMKRTRTHHPGERQTAAEPGASLKTCADKIQRAAPPTRGAAAFRAGEGIRTLDFQLGKLAL